MNRINSVRIQLIKEGSSLYSSAIIHGPESAEIIIRNYLETADREYFIMLALNNKNKVICINTVSIGSLNASIVHPREVFKAAILSNASAIIVAHNHPSGDISPSKEDILTTKNLVKAGKIMGIPVLDHIIIGSESNNWISLKEKGLLDT